MFAFLKAGVGSGAGRERRSRRRPTFRCAEGFLQLYFIPFFLLLTLVEK